MQQQSLLRLAEVINHWRRIKDKGIREVAKDIGISAATLSRIERGENCDGQTLAKIICWLLQRKTK